MKPQHRKYIPAAGLDTDAKKENLCGAIDSELNRERNLFLNFRKDKEEYAQIYAEFAPLIFTFLIKRTGDRLEADELTQETFCRAFSGFGKYEWRGISLRAYLFKIARNAYNSWYKNKVVHGGFRNKLNEEEMEGDGSADGYLMATENTAILDACLAKLTDNQRDALELFYWNKMKTRDISAIMKISESTVKSHLQRGRKAMKIQMQDMGLDLASFDLFTESEEVPTIKNNFWSFIKKSRKECS